MQDQIRSGSLILGVAIVLGLASLGYLLGNAAFSVKALERTVTVKGLSERVVAANIAIWPVTYQVASNDLDQIYNMVEANSRIIKEFLAAYGIAEDEISLSPPSVSDLYAQQWGDKEHIKFRYTGSAAVTVYSENVAAVREAMSNVVQLGKQGVAVGGAPYPNQAADRFLFTRLSELKPEMIEEATKNARSVAEKFAQDSNSRLGKIQSASQGQFSIVDRDSTTPYIKKVRVVSTIKYYLSD